MTGKNLTIEVDLVRIDELGERVASDGGDDAAAESTANILSFDQAAFREALHKAVAANCPGIARESLDALLDGPLLQQAVGIALLLDKPQGKA